jgi:hypothetical protein
LRDGSATDQKRPHDVMRQPCVSSCARVMNVRLDQNFLLLHRAAQHNSAPQKARARDLNESRDLASTSRSAITKPPVLLQRRCKRFERQRLKIHYSLNSNCVHILSALRLSQVRNLLRNHS